MSVKKSTPEHEAVKAQLANPMVRKENHIKLLTIHTTTQNIRTIQKQLAQGYSFDKPQLEALVNAMLGFINGIVSPAGDDKTSEVVNDTIVKE